jgi:hypothetical protein
MDRGVFPEFVDTGVWVKTIGGRGRMGGSSAGNCGGGDPSLPREKTVRTVRGEWAAT